MCEPVSSMKTSSSVGVRSVRLLTRSEVAPRASATGLSSAGPSLVLTTIRPSSYGRGVDAVECPQLGEHGAVVAVDVGHDEVLADGALQLFGRALRHQAAVVDDPDPVGERIGLVEVLRREEDGHAQLGVQTPDLRPHAGPAERVQPGGRLVEEEDLGPMDEGGGEIEPALHPARVGADPTVDGVADVDEVEDLAQSTPDLRASPSRRADPAASAARGRSGGRRGRSPAARRRCAAGPPGAGGPRCARRRRRRRRAAASSVHSTRTALDFPAPLGPRNP